jgi:hypothetical protein
VTLTGLVVRRSTSGYYMFVEGNLVSWKSKKKPAISRSTAKAEYNAIELGVAEILWLKKILEDLIINHGAKIKLCDNKSTISIANNLVQHDKIKPVKIDRFFIKDKLNNGLIKLNYVATGNQASGRLSHQGTYLIRLS